MAVLHTRKYRRFAFRYSARLKFRNAGTDFQLLRVA